MSKPSPQAIAAAEEIDVAISGLEHQHTQVILRTGDGEYADRQLLEAVAAIIDRHMAEREAALRATLELAHSHVEELVEAWRTGAIRDIDGKGAERSNRNHDTFLAIRRALEGATDE